MALQTLPNIFSYPGMHNANSGATTVAAGTTIDATGEYESIVICAREAMTISHVGFRVSTATASPTADIRIETVDGTTGLPTGTLWATNTNIVTSVISTGWTVFALTAAATMVKGDVFCVKVLFNTAASTLILSISSGRYLSRNLPYRVTNTGTPTKADGAVGNALLMVLGSGATTFYNIPSLLAHTSVAQNAFNNTSSARRGVRFQVPFNCRAVGLRFFPNAATGNFNAIMMSDAGSELSSSSTAFTGLNALGSASGTMECYFDNAVTLSAATWYRGVIEPSSATNCSISTLACTSASYLAAMPGGANYFYTTYVASSWTDTATDTVPFMDILIDQLDDGLSHIASRQLLGM